MIRVKEKSFTIELPLHFVNPVFPATAAFRDNSTELPSRDMTEASCFNSSCGGLATLV